MLIIYQYYFYKEFFASYMDRRSYLGVAGAAFLAGCSSSSNSGGGGNSTNSNSTEVTDAPTNSSTSGGSNNSDSSNSSGESSQNSTSESESDFRGPTSENRTYVDLQYREYSDEEQSTIRENAERIEFDELYRNVEQYSGDPVTYDGVIVQTLEADTHFTFLIALNNDPNQLVYMSWTGGRYIEQDTVRIWGEVLGIEIYQTGAGSERSVPAVSIADMELLESDEG